MYTKKDLGWLYFYKTVYGSFAARYSSLFVAHRSC